MGLFCLCVLLLNVATLVVTLPNQPNQQEVRTLSAHSATATERTGRTEIKGRKTRGIQTIRGNTSFDIYCTKSKIYRGLKISVDGYDGYATLDGETGEIYLYKATLSADSFLSCDGTNEKIIGCECLYFSTDQKTWTKARSACNDKGYQLANIANQEAFRQELLNTAGVRSWVADTNDCTYIVPSENKVYSTADCSHNYNYICLM